MKKNDLSDFLIKFSSLELALDVFINVLINQYLWIYKKINPTGVPFSEPDIWICAILRESKVSFESKVLILKNIIKNVWGAYSQFKELWTILQKLQEIRNIICHAYIEEIGNENLSLTHISKDEKFSDLKDIDNKLLGYIDNIKLIIIEISTSIKNWKDVRVDSLTSLSKKIDECFIKN